MVDVSIRDVPDSVVATVDARAKRLGLSRTEYLRRQLLRAVSTDDESSTVAVDDLHRFAEIFSDLDEPDVMRRAWQ